MDGQEQEWQGGEVWESLEGEGTSPPRTRSGREMGDSDRTRRQSRALRRSRGVGIESYFSERQRFHLQTRGQDIQTRGRGGEMRTRTQAAGERGRGGRGGELSGSLVDSDGSEVEILPDELRQLQREAGEDFSGVGMLPI